MDLKKASDDEKLALCKRYFYYGLAMLPLLWIVNVVWFFEHAVTRRPVFEQQKALRRYVVMSAIGAFVWLLILIVWQIVYQTQRVHWADVGDYISFVFPLGYA